MFSSPLGVIYISIRIQKTFFSPQNVLVPSRGYLYLNFELSIIGTLLEFSSPLGVIYISIRLCKRPTVCKQFSSPLGVIYISINLPSCGVKMVSGSRPLSGLSISQSEPRNARIPVWVLVPSRGYLYLNGV